MAYRTGQLCVGSKPHLFAVLILTILCTVARAEPLDADTQLTDPCDKIRSHISKAVMRQRRAESWQDVEAARDTLQRAMELTAGCPRLRGQVLFQMAEILKREGSPAAQQYYEDAITAETTEEKAAFQIHYADYLRNFRGPLAPLFPEAERQYFNARRTLAGAAHPDADRQNEVTRGLTALYERDGVPFLWSDQVPLGEGDVEERRPVAFFSTQNGYAGASNDFNKFDEARGLTMGALFAESDERIGGPLRPNEIRRLIHRREEFETFNRLRLRYRGLPAIDFFYRYIDADQAQNTYFDRRLGTFNDVKVSLYGLGIERTFDMYPIVDALVRVELARGYRAGLVEFLPNAREDVDAVNVLGVFSRFRGPDKLSLEVRYSFQDVDQQVSDPINRDQEIVAATFRYQAFSPATYRNAFAPRASEIFFGSALGHERFGSVAVNDDDFFVGFALRGLSFINFPSGAGRSAGRLDVVLQPTLYNGSQHGEDPKGIRVASLANSQYRTALDVLYRLQDYENEVTLEKMPKFGPIHLAVLSLVLPASQDVAVHNVDYYDDFRLGIELASKLIANLSTDQRYLGTTMLASAGYSHQEFYHAHKGLDLFHVNFRVGF